MTIATKSAPKPATKVAPKVDQRAARASRASRASRDPLPLSAKLERFTCFCGVILSVPPMEPNTVRITTCDCGRRWRQHT